MFEDVAQLVIHIVEIDHDERLVLITPKLLHDVALPYAAGTLNEQRTLPPLLVLPIYQLVVYLPFHCRYTFSRLTICVFTHLFKTYDVGVYTPLFEMIPASVCKNLGALTCYWETMDMGVI